MKTYYKTITIEWLKGLLWMYATPWIVIAIFWVLHKITLLWNPGKK